MFGILSVILGVLTALPMGIEELFVLPWLALPVMLAVCAKRERRFLHGFLFSMGYYVTVFHWFVELYPMDFAGFDEESAIALIITAITFMSVLQSLGTAFVFSVYGWLYEKVNRYVAPFVAASMWVLMEFGQTQFWYGVPWGKLALTQCGFLPEIQSASLLGSYFVAFIIVLTAGFFAETIISLGFLAEGYLGIKDNRPKKKKGFAKCLTVALALITANTLFGVVYMYIPTDNGEEITVAAIQGNISSTDKWADNSTSNSLTVYTELTKEAVAESGAKLVVWPESVITKSINLNSSLSSTVSALAKELDCDICVGAYYTEENEDGEETSYNSVYLFKADGTLAENIYKKRHLVPFGEYIPEREITLKIFPFLGEMNMFSSELGRGTDSEIAEGTYCKVGSLVCFDSIYPELARQSTCDGAEILTVSTNDSWYGDSAAIYEHNNQSVLRAVENGRTVVRAANTGLSSVIDSKGRVLSSLEPLEKGYVTATCKTSSGSTVYSSVGDVLVYVCAVIVCLAILIPPVVSWARKKADKKIKI